MSLPYTVRFVRTEREIAEARRLVMAHADARATTPGVEHVRADAAGLPGPYQPPRGGLWIAEAAGSAIGCVALRPLNDEAAEVKRMFVDPDWRGRGVGRAMLTTLIDAARALDYRILRLGTLDDMFAAQALYASLGFTPVKRYRADEMVDTRFHELLLQRSEPSIPRTP